MKFDTVYLLAMQAKIPKENFTNELFRFARYIVEHERDACLDVCKKRADDWRDRCNKDIDEEICKSLIIASQQIALSIKKRDQKYEEE